MRTQATVFEGVMSETPYAGQVVDWEPLGRVWLKLGARRRRERNDPSGPRSLETVTAETWADHKLRPGRRLRFEEADWDLTSVETVGGRMILALERTP